MAWKGSGVRVPSAPPDVSSFEPPGAQGTGTPHLVRWHTASVSAVVRLFIATHAVALRELLAQSLDEAEAFSVVGQCSSAAQALVEVPRVAPVLLVASRLLPDGTGADLVRSLRGAGSDVPALLLSNLVDVAML